MRNLLFSINLGLLFLSFGSCDKKSSEAQKNTNSEPAITSCKDTAVGDTVRTAIIESTPQGTPPKSQVKSNLKPESAPSTNSVGTNKTHSKTKKPNIYNQKGPDQAVVDSIKAAKTILKGR